MCGECGTLYRRCVWTKQGEKFAVWRCASRVDYGTKYCHDSPTLREDALQAAILAALNDAMSQREVLVGRIESAMRAELVSLPGEYLSAADIDRQLDGLNQEFQALFRQTSGADYLSHAEEFKRISDEMSALKEKRALLLEQQNSDSAVNRRIRDAVDILNNGSPEITEWNESVVRQLVDTVKVLSANRIRVYLRGGMESEQILKNIR